MRALIRIQPTCMWRWLSHTTIHNIALLDDSHHMRQIFYSCVVLWFECTFHQRDRQYSIIIDQHMSQPSRNALSKISPCKSQYPAMNNKLLYTIIFSVLKFSLPRWGAGRCNENFCLTGTSTSEVSRNNYILKLLQRLCWLVTVLWLTKRWVKWTLSSRAPSAWIDTLTPGRCRALTATARTASIVFPWNWIMEDR